MPIHNWSPISTEIFGHFHRNWCVNIACALNRGTLPDGISAMIEKREGSTDLANRIVVRHRLARIVAVIEIVSPGNKDSRAALHDFIDKTIDFMRRGVHFLVVDLFPPSRCDPFGMHKVIWDEIHEEDFQFPPGKDRILGSYEMDDERVAYVEPIGVGDVLPAMPLFLFPGSHVPVPLEATYMAAWEASPEVMRTAVETGVMSDPDAPGD